MKVIRPVISRCQFETFDRLPSALRVVSEEDPFIHELRPELNRVGFIDCQHADGRPRDAGSSDQDATIPLKMTFPSLAPRVKQRDDPFGQGIDTRDIWPFVLVVVETTPRQVLQNGLATVLLGDNVVDLERERIESAGNVAIVASIEGKSANLVHQGPIHSSIDCDGPIAFKDCRAFDCRIPKVCPTRM